MFGTIGRMEQRTEDPRPSITCPECHRTSWHPGDVKNRYCGFCAWWTSDAELAPHNPNPIRVDQNRTSSAGGTARSVTGG